MAFEESTIIAGPSFHVDLPALDALHPVHYGRRLNIFRCTSVVQRHQQVAVLKQALQILIRECPILGGVVDALPAAEAQNSQKNWRTIAPGPGLELVIRDLQHKLPSFVQLEKTGFQSSDLPYDLLVPVPLDIGNDRPFSACKVQYSAIEGGSIFAFGISHSVSDGGGVNFLMQRLTEAIRSSEAHLNDGSHNMPEGSNMAFGLDRSHLRNMKSDTPFDIKHHPAYVLKSSDSSSTTSISSLKRHPFEATSPEVPIVFRVSATALRQLKEDATTTDGPIISTHDALSGLVWRSISLIRSRRAGVPDGLVESTTASLFMPSDARRHLGVPSTYVGNVVYQLAATLEMTRLLASSGLKVAAGAVRRAITAVQPEQVASLVAKTAETWLDWGFMDCYSSTGVAMGTNWTSGVLYDLDWGQAFGPMVRFRYPGGYASNCVLPKLPNGDAEIMVSVMPAEIDMLHGRDCFGRYLGE